MGNTKYGLYGKIAAKEGKIDELTDILLQASKGIAEVKGCHLYVVSRSSEEPNSVWVYEVWDSKEDHDDSLKLESTQRLIAQAMPLLHGKQEGKSFEVMGGLGV